ncbi:MAG: type II toxin-antitoxin system VapC family toxin [Terrimicrobiaceae bacterium]|nr:type II toxin-antitoxin system VapC family toxin [Terrimicrobiaceae bacterium]
MIVADSNLIAYLHLPGPMSGLADAVLLKDCQWWVPPLWKSEFRSILFAYMRKQGTSLEMAQAHWAEAIDHLATTQMEPNASKVLALAADSSLSAYDAEFVVLAEELGIPLVTSDQQILREFPKLAVSPEKFVADA